jgi:hypothetical protein
MVLPAAAGPISVNFLRFGTGHQIAEIIGNSNDLQHMRREVSRGLFETLIAVCRADYQNVIESVQEILEDLGDS